MVHTREILQHCNIFKPQSDSDLDKKFVLHSNLTEDVSRCISSLTAVNDDQERLVDNSE